jgi:hypothetical protein
VIFQTLDDKAECAGIYANKELIFSPERFPSGLSETWSYSPYLRNIPEIEYASLYLEGESVADNIPEYLTDDWEEAVSKLRAFKRCLSFSKVDTMENCFYDLVPERFLIEFCEVKNKITKHILEKNPKPKRYNFYKHVAMMLGDIENQRIKLDRKYISTYLGTTKLNNQAQTLLSCQPYVSYNQFGTITGRLTTKKGFFPVLTLPKELRKGVLPTNDYYLELDFNGAEARTVLGLLGKEQPSGDIHDFHVREMFENKLSRSSAKTAFFAWLYGSKSAASKEATEALSKRYPRQGLLDNHWDSNTVRTPFGKVIPTSSARHAFNYLIQSTTAELALKQFLKVEYLLRKYSTGSRIAFLIHDSVVIDMKKEDEPLVEKVVELLRSTNFGSYKMNVKQGSTLGS